SDLVNIDAIFVAAEDVLYDVRNTIKKIDLGGYTLAVKSFRKPRWPQSLIYARWRASKAERSFKNALALLERGIATPEPVAFIKTISRGKLNRSYYIARFHAHESSLAPLLQKAGDTSLPNSERSAACADLQAFVEFSYQMHEAGALHRDHNAGNTLVSRDGNGNGNGNGKNNCRISFAIIDINRLVFRKLGLHARLNNFVRLTDNETVLRLIARHYGAVSGNNPDKCERLLFRLKRRHLQKLALKKQLKQLVGRGN
ncbi:MAG: lipopolysaccharide kinase InaA family protein, partial [Pseudomonadales bacterium]